MTTRLVSSIEEIRNEIRSAQRAGQTVGLVPTMGALHAGHLELIKQSTANNDRTVVTLFVNPTQFTDATDLNNYPRDVDTDLAACQASNVDSLFAPSVEEMYPEKPLTFVNVEGVSEGLCGDYRPGHFRGVATVCAKLFSIAPADRAYFGQKDYQQLAVIRRLVQDLNLAIEIIGVPTVREGDGLAMSSRNRRLSPEERRAAPVVYRALEAVQAAVLAGEQDATKLIDIARAAISTEPLARIEYIEIVDRDTIAPVDSVDTERRIAAAVWFGNVRLIDNIALIPK
ncbi:MAG: pantoate--beta-alanine ligase [Polyangiales bacterium]|jgi:pantoate--beta-alanine ligase